MYSTGHLPIVLYERAVVFCIKRRTELRVFKNKVLRKIFGLQEGESTKTLERERENCVLRRLMSRAFGLNRG
jgi:hypothetical protein